MRKLHIMICITGVLILTILGCGSKTAQNVPAAAQVGDSIITIKDIEVYKKMKDDSLSDKQAVDMLVEKNILYQEAVNESIDVSLQDAKEYAQEQRKIIETTGGEESKKVIDELIQKIGVSYDEYWEDYAPRGYMRTLSETNMKKRLNDDIREELLKESPGLSGDEMVKAINEKYNGKIDELKLKYSVKYYIQ